MTEQTLGALAPYSAVRASIEDLKAKNAALMFDYTKPVGIKAAKSHIHKLRGVNGEIERVRKAAKADALEYGRKVDAAAKELAADVATMIDVHEAPINAIEQREATRKAAHEARMLTLNMPEFIPVSSADIQTTMDGVATTKIDESWEEYEAPARKQRDVTLQALADHKAAAVKREADAAELERLRREKEERERADREARIASEAAARAKREAEEAAMAEARRKEAETQAALEAERRAAAKREADLKAEAERVRREAADVAAKAEAARKADEKRAADKKHRDKVLSEVAAALAEYGDEKQMADAIAEGKIPHVRITF